jgi:hypothetical protein
MPTGDKESGIFIVFDDDLYFVSGDQDATLNGMRKALEDAGFLIEANHIDSAEYFGVNSSDIHSLLNGGITIRKGRKVGC